MKHRMIGRQVKFESDVEDGTRCWYVDGWWCRGDSGPVFEDMKTGLRKWIGRYGDTITNIG